MYKQSNYKLINGGFPSFTRNVSFGKDGLIAEKIISLFYYEQGLRVYSPNKAYISYIDRDEEV